MKSIQKHMNPVGPPRLGRGVWLGISLLALLVGSGCKPEPCEDWTNPECPNYCVDETDPACPNFDICTRRTPVSADFRIIENGSYGLIQLFDTVYYDTVWSSSLITEAIHVHSNWTYTWYIGSGTYEGTRTALGYNNAPRGVPISMTLVVEGPPVRSCFPDDDGRDTVTRTVVIEANRSDTTIYAGYRNGNPQDSLTLTFYYDYAGGQSRFSGLTDSCDAPIADGAGTRRTSIFKDASSGCNVATIKLVRDPQKVGDFQAVSGEYSYYRDLANRDEPRLEFTFHGRQIR